MLQKSGVIGAIVFELAKQRLLHCKLQELRRVTWP